MLLVNAMFHPVIAGILLAAILAAIMSTADSQLRIFICNGRRPYKQVLWQRCTSEEIVRVGRFAVIIISLIARFLAMTPDRSCTWPCVLQGLSWFCSGIWSSYRDEPYWSRMNRVLCSAGIVVGVTIVLLKQFTGVGSTLYCEIVPGIILSTLSIVIVA